MMNLWNLKVKIQSILKDLIIEMKNILLFLVITAFFSSCSKKCELESAGKQLDFYFLEQYKTKANSFEILPESIVLSKIKAITYKEIYSYSKKSHCFEIDKNAIKRLNNEPYLHSKAFALVIDNEIIYTGYFWSAFSSAICDWTNIDYLDYGNNLLCVKLGYPTDSFGLNHPDERNNDKILELLKCDNKLDD